MTTYMSNARWLTIFSPFRSMSISAAYLMPFLQEKGLSVTEVLVLQALFSAMFLVWEIPSGMVADRFGRAFSIKLSVPIAGLATIAYGFSDQFWQFVVCELLLALANGLISGIDTTLLLDSLKAEGRGDEFVKRSQRMDAAGYAATAIGVPVAIALVYYVSLSATLIADGLLTLVGAYAAFKLVEAPRTNGSQEAVRLSAWRAMRKLARNPEARWLTALGAALSTATYLGFWLSAPYYTELGVPLVLFSVVLAVRSAAKAWLAHRFEQRSHVERNMVVYASLAGIVLLAMASGQPWLLFMVFGHDVVQALHKQPVTAQLNEHIEHEFRATMNSLVNLVQRLAFSITGPLVGLLVDHAGLATGLAVTGICCSGVAFTALARLHRYGTFKVPEKR